MPHTKPILISTTKIHITSPSTRHKVSPKPLKGGVQVRRGKVSRALSTTTALFYIFKFIINNNTPIYLIVKIEDKPSITLRVGWQPLQTINSILPNCDEICPVSDSKSRFIWINSIIHYNLYTKCENMKFVDLGFSLAIFRSSYILIYIPTCIRYFFASSSRFFIKEIISDTSPRLHIHSIRDIMIKLVYSYINADLYQYKHILSSMSKQLTLS